MKIKLYILAKQDNIDCYSIETLKPPKDTDYVVSEILPSIRKSGVYITKQAAIDEWGSIDNDEYKAKLIVDNPRGERALHYEVVK